MELLDNEITVKTDGQKLKEYLDNRGIRYIFLSEKLEVDKSYLSHVFSGKFPLGDPMKAKIEMHLNAKIF